MPARPSGAALAQRPMLANSGHAPVGRVGLAVSSVSALPVSQTNSILKKTTKPTLPTLPLPNPNPTPRVYRTCRS
eukprot:9473309-Karenia_brevis.AAC.1